MIKLIKRLRDIERPEPPSDIGLLESKLSIARLLFIEEADKLINVEHPQMTLHDLKHSEAALELASEICDKAGLLTGDNPYALTKEEIFFLAAGCYLHDIGMIYFDRKKITELAQERKSSEGEIVRSIHHHNSGCFVIENRKRLYLDETEAEFLCKVCKGHRKEEKLDSIDYENLAITNGISMRLSLICAILRIADELDLDYKRAPKNIMDFWDWRGWSDPISKIHWIKHFYTQSCQITVLTKDRKHIICPLITLSVPDELHENEIKNIIISHLDSEIKSIRSKSEWGVEFGNAEIRSIKAPKKRKHFLKRNDIRILIIDDDNTYSIGLQEKVEKAFGPSLAAKNAWEAFEICQRIKDSQEQIHIVLLDLEIPRSKSDTSTSIEEGILLIRILSEAFPELIIIVNTSHGPEHMRKCIKAGAHDFHEKINGREIDHVEKAISKLYHIV